MKKNRGGGYYAALIFLFLILVTVGGYLLFGPSTAYRASAPLKDRPAVPVRVDRTPSTAPAQQHSALENRTGHGRPAAETPQVLPSVRPDVRPSTTDVPAKGALLAIIIDDMGTSLQEARSLAAIGVPLTFSIIPGLKSVREVVSFAETSNIETMIHIPMQSKGWPGRRLESNGLLMSMTEKEITERTESYIRAIPKAAGANNHTGSEFTEHEDKMRAVLGVLKGKGLFYVDSVTSPDTVGEDLAREMGIRTGKRQVFLDNEQHEAYILGQLRQAVRLARRSGSAIAICHPHPATIHTLEKALPDLARQGITFVAASRLVR